MRSALLDSLAQRFLERPMCLDVLVWLVNELDLLVAREVRVSVERGERRGEKKTCSRCLTVSFAGPHVVRLQWATGL